MPARQQRALRAGMAISIDTSVAATHDCGTAAKVAHKCRAFGQVRTVHLRRFWADPHVNWAVSGPEIAPRWSLRRPDCISTVEKHSEHDRHCMHMETVVAGHIQVVIRLTVGFILIVSALTKLRSLPAFVEGVLDYRVLPPTIARPFGWFLPFVELGTAVFLLTDALPLLAGGLTLLLLISFALALAINAGRGRAIPCYCFGADQQHRIGWHTLVRDVVLLPPAGWLLWAAVSGTTQPMPPSLFPRLSVLAIAMLGALVYRLTVESLDLFFANPLSQRNY